MKRGETESELQRTFDYLKFRSATSKEARINFAAISYYIESLKTNGLALNSKYIKKLRTDLWELRPRKNRILFFTAESNTFVLLHMFVKKTQKTPTSEITRALNEIYDYKNGGKNNG